MSRFSLDAATAAQFARIALGHVQREFPYKLEHALAGPEDVLRPSELYPIFYGSFDWHSCVHSWWSLLTLRRLFPGTAEAGLVEEIADDSFTREKTEKERAYIERPLSRTFERPYGWAWLLYLHLEASRHEDRNWAAALEPLARAIAERFRHYLPILTYPIRSGAHFNTAFALTLAMEWADEFDAPLSELMRQRSRNWFGNDRNCPAWEPSGDDFLSPSLCEALCMSHALPRPEFEGWFAAFLPALDAGEPATLFTPASVSDRSDGKIAHLDGLNLSRAWCWRNLAYPEHAERHQEAAMPHIAGDYMGEHWLVSFALLALLA